VSDLASAEGRARRIARTLFTSSPPAVARQFLWFGFAFLWVGGVMAMNLRWHLAFPGRVTPFIPFLFFRTNGVIAPHDYLSLFTLHGTVMIFFAVNPLVIGWLGSLLVPFTIGAKAMVFPRLHTLAFWLTFAGGMVLLTGMYVPFGGPAAGWTSYPPLSATLGSPGTGQSYWCAAIMLASAGTLAAAINIVSTVVRLRAPGMDWFRMPLTTWGLFLASVLNVLFVPVLIVATGLLWLDRSFGTRFFEAGMATSLGGGDPLLYQHLFWIFGHPEVYVVILPIWGVVSDVLAVFSRKPAYGYRSTALALVAVTVLSAVVYGHHMFTTGMSPLLAQAFMSLTLVISVPSAVFVFNWLGTLAGGAIRFEPPMLYALGMIVVFAIGGLTGIFLGNVTTDVYLHDTFFVVGHFHFVMAASVLMGFFAAFHFWFPRTFGRMLHRGLARWHFALTLALIVAVFGTMLALGWSGMLRRLPSIEHYAYLRPFVGLNRAVSIAAFALFATQFLFIGNVFWSLWRGPIASANPWDATTLEWTAPDGGFESIPVVHQRPHEFAHSEAPAGRDYVMQNEDIPRGGDV
jgi:cytochrome c oxidase subunit 1